MTAATQIKIIYAQAAKPGVSRTTFVEQWREHGSLAMACPDYWQHIDKYIQADVLARDTDAARGDSSYFGVGELCYATVAARDAGLVADSRATRLMPHGQSIWAHPKPISVHCSSEQVFRRREGQVKVYVMLSAPKVPLADVQRGWDEWAHATSRQLAGNPFACSYERSTPLEAGGAVLGIDEFEFDNAAAAVDFLNGPYREGASALVDVLPIVTERVVLFRRSSYEA